MALPDFTIDYLIVLQVQANDHHQSGKKLPCQSDLLLIVLRRNQIGWIKDDPK